MQRSCLNVQKPVCVEGTMWDTRMLGHPAKSPMKVQVPLGAKRKPAVWCSRPGCRTQSCPCLSGLGTLVPGSPHVCSQVALTAGAAKYMLEANTQHLKCLGVELS